eukprot:6197728-Pleurochrysis_carterae.AAC.1
MKSVAPPACREQCLRRRLRKRACACVRAFERAFGPGRVCACVRARACVREGAWASVRACASVRARACVRARVRERMCACVRARACVCARVCMCASVRARACVRACSRAPVSYPKSPPPMAATVTRK